MSPVRVTCGRTVGLARNMYSTAVAVGGFLAAVAALFAFNLESAEGGRLPLVAVWAVSVSPVLPVLAAFLAMDTWSDERRSGRLDVLLTTAVLERDLMLGKFLGVLLMVVSATVVSLLSSLAFLLAFAPEALAGVQALGVFSALFGLFVQGALWCAVSVMASAFFAHAAVSAVASVVVTVGLPRGIWVGLMAWSPQGRTAFGEFPLDAHALDMASGVVSVGTVLGYLAGAVAALFVASKVVAAHRLVGRGSRGLRFSTGVAVVLSLLLCGLVLKLSARIETTVDFPIAGAASRLSPRTRGILAESDAGVSVTCFLPRSDVRFRPVDRFLRLLKREAVSAGGTGFDVRYVDPRWDIGAAERLISRGVAEDSLVFERGRRMVAIPFREGYGERVCASAIRRLTTSPSRRNVYWTVGHGECRFDDYGTFGMSDIARDLSRDGFSNRSLDLAAAAQVPNDCALVVIAGAREPFARAELGRIDSYLRDGGRLLVLLGPVQAGGVAAMLPTWGIRMVATPLAGASTLSGSDVVVSDFSDHQIAASLRGSRIVLERPLSFVPSAAAETGSGADRIDFTPVAKVGASTLAVVAERGAGAGDDLAIRPTRIVAVGDATFAMNGSLASQANANRDFLLNCAAYLSGTEVVGVKGTESDLLVTGMDRETRLRFVLASVAALPGAVFLVMFAVTARRRRRKS